MSLALVGCDDDDACVQGARCSEATATAGPSGAGAASSGSGGAGGAPTGTTSVGAASSSTTPATSAGPGGASDGGGGGGAPSVPPCFPAGTDDFDDPLVSTAIWPSASNVELTGDVASLGVDPDVFSVLTQVADTPAACFVSFVMNVVPEGHGYLLVSPQGSTPELDDLDVEVSIDAVHLYTRGGSPVNGGTVDRFGDRFLLLIGADRAVLHGALADDSGWIEMSELALPPFRTAGRILRFIKYDFEPPLTVDDVNILPPALLASFPPPP
ncbi:MAG: hypothetical protein WKG00_10875 [Polyangiaceae bacterium]